MILFACFKSAKYFSASSKSLLAKRYPHIPVSLYASFEYNFFDISSSTYSLDKFFLIILTSQL